jgi:hypothetical protein
MTQRGDFMPLLSWVQKAGRKVVLPCLAFNCGEFTIIKTTAAGY